ncbi:hypothetical protein [Burkholderia cenocepacia]|uniref:hypothetical protein n=1 Tax=Burkholderia cenocepacia TaxID=95486 RepID=UPI000981E2C1|nr:hypothetical protein [Burkholderia cenocepacia]MBR8290494.1 hypothetical protein [Burkholderia cenocepacia]ONU62911.1 hypothetical protein A8E62_13870 [Burkholderia cenocepacia]ONU91455.1 hypothetical protein A8E63_10160 [Burkholderia cenocepacia]
MNSKIEGQVLETDDFVTHRKAWRDALLIVRDNGFLVGLDDGPLNWDISIQAFDDAFALYAPGSIPDGFRSNHEAWRLALTIARDLATVQGPDIDDEAYWQHEIRAFDRAFASVGIRLVDGKLPELTELCVENLRAGDKVDLNSCPFLKESASADFEFAVVESVDRETAGCVVVSYEDHAVVGYPVGSKLKVSSETLGTRKLPEASDHADGAGHLNGQVVAAPDLIATLDNAESFIVGFEGDQQQEGIDDLLRDIRTAKGALKAQRKLLQSTVEMTRADGTSFSDRVRFNRGFHDGSAEAERAVVRDVNDHHDPIYADGYVRGVLAWKNLGYRPESSEEAWSTHQGLWVVPPQAAKLPEIRECVGAVAPGSGGYLVGAGKAESPALDDLVDNAAELLRTTFGVAVEKRYNSDGRSGGSWVVTDGKSLAIGSNSGIGINVRLTESGSFIFHVYVKIEHLRNASLATCNGFGKYAYPEVASIPDALNWIQVNVKLPEVGVPPDMKPVGALMDVDVKKHLAEEAEPPALPADPEGMNDDRASWAGTAISAFQQATRCEDGDAVADLLAGLMHYCDRNGLSFETELGRARQHHAEETSEASTQAVSPGL